MTDRPKTHPLAQAYLAELAALLRHLDPVEREEAMLGVQGHIEDALAHRGESTEEVRRVLSELGSPATVAEAAYADSGAGARAPSSASRVIVVHPPRRWAPQLAAAFLAVAFLVGLLTGGTSGGYSETSVSSSDVVSSGTADGLGRPPTQRVVESSTTTSYSGVDAAGTAGRVMAGGLLFWIIGILIGGATSLWTGREKVLLAASLPAFALLVGLLPWVAFLTVGALGLPIGFLTALVAGLVALGWLLTVLLRRARVRAGQLETGLIAQAQVAR